MSDALDQEVSGEIAGNLQNPVSSPRVVDPMLSVVVPVYNSSQTLVPLLARLDNLRLTLEELGVGLQILFVDDGSRDNSFHILAERYRTRRDIVVIKLSRNFGAIGALKTVLPHVSGDAFIFLAADLQDPPELIPRMVQLWQEGKTYVIARRKQRQDTKMANFSAGLFYWLLRRFVAPNYPIHGFDLALMDKRFQPYLQRTGKHINFPLYPFWLGFEPTYITYEREIFIKKPSSWTFLKKINLAIDSVLAFSRGPTRLLFVSGISISLLSLFYAMFIIVSAVLGQLEVPGFATIIVLLSVLQGVTILFLGILSEYIWRIFDEVNGHPEAVVDVVLDPQFDANLKRPK